MTELDYSQPAQLKYGDPKRAPDYKTRLLVERDKNLKMPPPLRNCFQEIMGLETLLAQEEIEELKKKKIN